MKKRLLLTLVVLLIAVIGVVAWGVSGWRQRTFNEKTESEWISGLGRQWTNGGVEEIVAEHEEWYALGPQATPILLKAVEMQPGPGAKIYAKLWSKLPATVQNRLPLPVDYRRIHMVAWSHLASQRTNAAIPAEAVVRALKDQDWIVRNNALCCLDQVILPNARTEKGQFLPSLIEKTEDQQMEVRMIAVVCLGYYRDQANLVVPVLTNALANPYPDVRIRAAMALDRIDPNAAERAGVKAVAHDCLKSDGPNGSAALAAKFLQELEKPSN